MKGNKFWLFTGLGTLLLVLMVSVSSNRSDKLPSDQVINQETAFEKRQESTASADKMTQDNDAGSKIKEFRVSVKNWSLKPSVLVVNVGDQVKLTFEDVVSGLTLSLPGFGFEHHISSGEATTGEFTAVRKGEYSFICSSGCPEGKNQLKGRLLVE